MWSINTYSTACDSLDALNRHSDMVILDNTMRYLPRSGSKVVVVVCIIFEAGGPSSSCVCRRLETRLRLVMKIHKIQCYVFALQ